MVEFLKRGLVLIALASPAPALAQPASIDEVVVTAERTNRTLKDTASSVAVATGQDIARAPGMQTTYDVLQQIPNVVATSSSNSAPAIRGIDGGGPAIGANAFFAGTRPRVNFQVDGRTLTFNEAIYLDGGIWDAQQVEVYRGPQSTLQGRNAIGGVIALKTADPTFTWQGNARALVGEDNLRQVSAAIGGPLLADNIAFRLAADHRQEDAYVRTTPFAELPDPGHFSSDTLRGKLLITPVKAPDVRSLLTLSYTDAYAPQVLSVGRPFTNYAAPATTITPRFETRALVGIADNSWQVTDRVGLSAFLTATDFRVNRTANAGNGIAQIDGDEYTAEPRLRLGRKDDALSGFVAAYVFDADQKEAIDLFGGGKFRDKTFTDAVFGEATWRPLRIVDVTFGARYEKEKRDRTGGAGVFLIDYHKTFDAFLPKATVTVRPDKALTFGATIGRGYNAGGAGFAFNPPFPSFTYDKEMVWNYEGFVRGELFGGRLSLNGNLFYNDYSGLQLPFDVAQNPSAPATVIRNAPKATTYGLDTEARFRAMPGLDFTAGAGLLRTRVDKYDDPSIQGHALPRAPAFTLSAGVIAAPLRNVDVSVNAHYTDAYYSDVFSTARGRTKPYAIANAQAGYRIKATRLFVAVTNLFDEQTPELYSPATVAANDIAYMTRPRRVSAGFELAF